MTDMYPTHSRIAATLGLFFWCLISLAAVKAAHGDDADLVAPYVFEQTCMVVRIDTSRPDKLPTYDRIAAILPGDNVVLQRVVRVAGEKFAAICSASGKQTILATAAIPDLRNRDWPSCLVIEDPAKLDQQALVSALGGPKQVDSFIRDGVLVLAERRYVDASTYLESQKLSHRPEIRDAFEAVAGDPVQVLILPPDYVRQTIKDLMPELPAALGGGPSSVVTRGLVWAAIGIDPEKLGVRAVIQSASDEAARALAEHLPTMIEGVCRALPEEKKPMPVESLRALSQVFDTRIEGSRVTIRFAGTEAAGGGLQIIAASIESYQRRVQRQQGTQNVKSIMISIHNHHDAYGMLPPRDEARNEDGSPRLSWRVHVLPFLGERVLYEQFHLDEPWDSPHNNSLIEKIPEVYRSQDIATPPGYTTLLAPVGENTAFGGAKPTRLSQITDGLSNTIAIVQVKPELAVPWTAPKDYAFDPQDPAAGLQSELGGFLCGMVDGSVHWLPVDMKPEIFLRLFRISDGEEVKRDDLQ